jgi:hypothetical protein
MVPGTSPPAPEAEALPQVRTPTPPAAHGGGFVHGTMEWWPS